jgi:glyoxylase-like metal-dependent hydrolase (beta-lactamase superfamily II)
MTEVAKDVFSFTGTDVNWVIVREGDSLTLVDGGWRGDGAAVLRSIRSLGHRPEDVRAVLITHAHVDHLGGVRTLHDRYGTPAYAHPQEVPHAHRDYLEQATPMDLVKRLAQPGVLGWSLRILAARGFLPLSAQHAQPFPRPGALDLPGRPIPVPCPGHTSGHCAYLLAEAGVLVTGDALVTGHPTSRETGPQLLPGHFTHSHEEALRSLEALGAVDADLLVPGHGEPWRGTPREAAALALERTARR